MIHKKLNHYEVHDKNMINLKANILKSKMKMSINPIDGILTYEAPPYNLIDKYYVSGE